jgi:hypothetical protein
VQDGSVGKICPQGFPAWTSPAEAFVASYLSGKVKRQLPPVDPRTTEDCLVLDVVVPKNVLQQSCRGNGAPVLGMLEQVY